MICGVLSVYVIVEVEEDTMVWEFLENGWQPKYMDWPRTECLALFGGAVRSAVGDNILKKKETESQYIGRQESCLFISWKKCV